MFPVTLTERTATVGILDKGRAVPRSTRPDSRLPPLAVIPNSALRLSAGAFFLYRTG
jgi:hypothetical protein